MAVRQPHARCMTRDGIDLTPRLRGIAVGPVTRGRFITSSDEISHILRSSYYRAKRAFFQGGPVLLYVHVPFCRKKCLYCAFFSQVLDMGALEVYCDALIREMRLWSARLSRPAVSTVYFGGGTPTLLPAWALSRIMPELAKCFEIAPDAEFTFEANPDSAVDAGYMRDLRGYGVNRLSIGVQSLADADLAFLGRPHGAQDAVMAYALARRAGFANISLDFLWGLPGQRVSQWLEELKTAVKMRPEHLSCYGLTVEPDTPLEALVDEGGVEFPEESEQARMFMLGAEYLEAEGYLQYEISNFARMGYQSRHNSGYWEGRDYLGLGPSAVSTINGARHENPKDIKEYARMTREKTIGADARTLTREETISEMVMLGLRTSKGLSLSAYRQKSGRDFLKDNAALIQGLRQNELIRINRGFLRLTKNGMLVSNVILSRLQY